MKVWRNLVANDATIRGYLGAVNATEALKWIRYSDTALVQIEDFYQYPCIISKFNEDESTLRGSDSNTPIVITSIYNSTKNDNYAITNMRIRDRLKQLLRDNHEALNSQAVSLSLSLKVRDVTWVGSITYDDKTQGTERLHKIICTQKFIVGE
jgi:hypothetical protein